MNKGLLQSLLMSVLVSLSLSAFAETIEYTIPEGTSDNLLDWNDRENPLRARVGDTLVIHNGDTQPHQLHTNGAPCDHGALMQPGESWSCELVQPYNSITEALNGKDPIRDHLNYDLKFWLIVE